MPAKKESIWQLRLGLDEDRFAEHLAERQRISKNAVVNQVLRLLAKVENERASGARILIERRDTDGNKNVVELWLLI